MGCDLFVSKENEILHRTSSAHLKRQVGLSNSAFVGGLYGDEPQNVEPRLKLDISTMLQVGDHHDLIIIYESSSSNV